MLQLSAFYVLLITFTVSVSAKLHSDADNTTETGSSVSELYTESSVVNDNICNNHEKNVAFDVILFDNKLPPQQGGKKSVNKRQAPRDNRKDYKDRPRPDQKSLLIVFDATASMHDDLEQLRAGAQEIVSELSARDDNPIFNYVLVVYRDPNVEPPFDTRNPDELLSKLKNIQIVGGGDCPEYALSGLKIALEFALPNSLAYVFSDATAKDLGYHGEVSELIQQKQVTVNFLLTGDCENPTGPGYQIYLKLSRASNGQVYDMNKSNVKDVLLAIRHSVNYNYAALKSVDAESAGTTNTKLNIDKSISELSVSLSGRNPKLTITDPHNETVRGGDELTLKNLKLVKIKDPADGVWNVEAAADSSHSIRLGAISEMKFEFGFSLDEPTKKAETWFQPLVGQKNVLSVFISDPSLIQNLTDVTIIVVPSDLQESSTQFKVSLRKIDEHIYATKAFDIPRQMFKIHLNGADAEGKPIERLLSTGLKSSQGSVPVITIRANQMEINEFELLSLRCVVQSHSPLTITWTFSGRTLKQLTSNQSNDLELVIDHVVTSNSGLYTCEASNTYGRESRDVSIKVLSAPKVLMIPNKISAVENATGVLECIVENTGGDEYKVSWLDAEGNVLNDNNSISYEFIATRNLHNKTITCRVQSGDFEVSNSSLISVEYSPKFVEQLVSDKVKIRQGGSFRLNCETDENPKGAISWFYTAKTSNVKQSLQLIENEMTIENMNEAKQGKYDCEIENFIGKVGRSFEVSDHPKGPPKIQMDKDIIIVNETDSIDLVCESLNSLPITNYTWINENSNNYETFVIKDEAADVFRNVLRITDIDESDNGSFECYLVNELGHDKISFELLVQTTPKVDAIIMKVNGMDSEIENEVSVLESDDLTLDCVVDGFPTPEVRWFRDQEELETVNDSSLTIQKVLESHSGIYQCVASNILGTETKNFNLKVNVPPKAEILKENVVKVIENDNVELNCDVKGSPTPAVSWFVNGNYLTDVERFKFIDHDKLLSFNAQLTDSGIYSCSGVNDFGSVEIKFTVVVLSTPNIISSNDEYKKVKAGENLALSCDATGFPQPHISWSKDDKVIRNGSNIVVENMKLDDLGVYICDASNEIGISQKVFFVTVVETPKITSALSNVTLLTNNTQELNCRATGTPDPEIYWTFDGFKVTAGTKLTLDSAKHSGFYTCVAENSEGKDESSFYFQAVNKPSLMSNSEELKRGISLREGDDFELFCPFENFNSIDWTFNSGPIESFAHESNENKLTLRKIDRKFNGEWKCIVSNVAGNDSFSFNVTVLASPVIHASWNLNNRVSDFLFTESDIDERTFKAGEKLELNCTAFGYPKPKVYWKKATDVISEGESLVIENLQFHHSDIYTCGAENNQGIVKKFFKIDVVAAPYVEDANIQKSYQKAIGDSVMLRCKLIGNPIPNIFWFKDNVLLDETESFLEIKKLTLSDDGAYKCIGKNSWGKESLNFHIGMMEPAKIISAEEEQKVHRNENSMTISCSARGNPMPIISWISNGHILSTTSKLNLGKLFSAVQDSEIYFNGFGNSITYLDPFKLKQLNDKFYSKLTKLDDKTMKLDLTFRDRNLRVAGNYQCYAYNALGRDDRTVEVKILEKPFVNEKQVDQLNDNEVLEGLPLLLTCLISGEPTPKISWFKDNSQIHENDTIKLLSENRFLSIAETFSWNSGNYSCKGVNKIGEQKLNFHVVVLAPPKFIDYSIVSPLNSNRFHNDKMKIQQKKDDEVRVIKGEDVSLECFAEGSPSPNVHWLKMDFYDSKKNELLDENDNVLIIRSIKESSNFMCYLNNTIGNIRKIFNVVIQFSPEFVDDQKTEHHHAVKLHHGVNLYCKSEGNPEPSIKWIFNGSEILTTDKDFYISNDNQIMRIVDTKKSNQGKYLCQVENDFGKLERVFYVNVEVPIQWSSFGAWSTCSVSCGAGGIQYRTRICLLTNGFPAIAEDYKCVGENVEARKCNRLPCPINGGWGKFSKWSACPACIVEKSQDEPVLSKRVRKCDSPIPSNGGLECFGPDTEEVECKVSYCAIKGGWSDWTQWSGCSKTCGVGHRTRKRFCNNPSPKHNGTACDGENVEYEECKLSPCKGHNLKKTFNADDEDDLEELSNELRDKYKEVAEFEIKDEDGVARNFQFMKHREVEYAPPLYDSNGKKLPKITVTLDTYKPISEETYKQHFGAFLGEDGTEETESTSFENLDFESPEDHQNPPKTCMRGFYYNTISKQCEDVNECQNRRQNNCATDETCVNILGSYRCDKKRIRRSRNGN